VTTPERTNRALELPKPLRTVLDDLGVPASADRAELLPIAALRPAHSPRLAGEQADHTRALAEVEDQMPPILVHRRTMRVIDGMHRLRAAQLRGRRTIEVRFVDTSEELAFVLSVAENVSHGLPLSVGDRRAAAHRIVELFPHWSNGVVASATGLAAQTVAAIRRRTGGRIGQPPARVGRDGRLRPVDRAAGRQTAIELIAKRPAASLREIARAAGVSPATVKDVRDRLRRGEDPVAATRRGARSQGYPGNALPLRAVPQQDPVSILEGLKNDPSLRSDEAGRELLRWLDGRVAVMREWERLVSTVPAHCSFLIAELAQGCADEWMASAVRLRDRVRAEPA
jgi:hypothetical protein